MSMIDGPVTFAKRWILRALRRVDRLRSYNDILHHGSIDKEAAGRLRASSWWGADPHWYVAGTPPRQHNRVTPLIDGESFFTALRQSLETARDYVYIAGWCLTPHIPLGREDRRALVETQLLEMLSRAAERLPVRILLWSGDAVLLQPTTHAVEAVQATIEKEGRGDILCLLDRSAHPTHCHHQKAIVVDGQTAFVGGMDLTTFSGDRYDCPSHPLRTGQNWHDVQIRIEGEAVADVEHNFRQRWEATVEGETPELHLPHREPAIETSWQTPVQIMRTVPGKVYDFAPNGEFGNFHFYMQAFKRAKRLIYIENQYIWSPHVMKALLAAMVAPRAEPFRIVIVLPAFAGSGRWDNDKHVAELRKADKGRGIVSIYSPYSSGPNLGEHPFTYRAIYVHAKVAVIDDEWLTVGSANLNNRGLITDTEINAVVHDAELARRVRVDLWAEHLNLTREEIEKVDPIDLADRVWPARAGENAEIIKHGEMPLVAAVHEYTVGHKPSDLVLEDIQSLALEH
jgi:phosphatidylserine/phosphatidylglycerophosphate/cardiolipin synthase-like enzyme